MKVYVLESIYYQKINNANNWMTAIFIKKENAEKMKTEIEKRIDIESCHIIEYNVNDVNCLPTKCKCKSEMEIQLVCENCGKHESLAE